MAQILVPFRGAEGKRRFAPATREARVALGLAMLADVLSASSAVGPTTVVTGDEAAWRMAAELQVEVLGDVPLGQGAAVGAALARLNPPGPVLVVNADLPCAQPDDLRELLRALPSGGVAIAPAGDGTTNALALADPALFRQLYGRGSAERFIALGRDLEIPTARFDHPNLADDVDTIDDLRRVEARAGPRTQAALAMAGLARVA